MDNHRFSTTSSSPSMSTIRNALNARAPKEKISPALKKALELLNLKDLDGLEHHFLGTIAFLKPWSQFRDSFMLLQPGSKSRASEPDKVRGIDILWFYTNFSDGELRYDPRADDTTSLFTVDEAKYGTFDTTYWGVEEHEKMMYAWLLQEFKVGKARNPFGLEYFELQNVCTAWRTVFVPILEAVRDSYDPRGRRHYGRLARFIEERHPSRVAFPEGNLAVPQSANPYRMVSYPRERGVMVSSERLTGDSPLSSSEQAETVTRKQETILEQELRGIYPKYGHIVEKPKWRPVEFFASQKAKIKRKNQTKQDTKEPLFGNNRSGRESPMFGCRGIGDPRVIDPAIAQNRRSGSTGGRLSFDAPPSPKSPEKRVSKREKSVVPIGMYGFIPTPAKEKSPLHGVTRRLSFPDTVFEGETTEDMITHLTEHARSVLDLDRSETQLKPTFARPGIERKDSDSVYSLIRNSNPFMEDPPGSVITPERKTSVEVLSPMSCHPSAIPKPLFNTTKRKESRSNVVHGSIPESPSSLASSDLSKLSRMPSYAGTGYDREIKPPFIAKSTKLPSTLEHNAYGSSSRESSFVLSEIPEVTHPLERHDRATGSGDSFTLSEIPEMLPPYKHQDSEVLEYVTWPGMTPSFSPQPLAWPGQTPTATSPIPTEWPRASRFEDAVTPPPIPPRHPARTSSVRSSTESGLPPPPIPKLLGPRIVSKENIRGHLSNISRDISEESLKRAVQLDVMPTSKPTLTPFNKNMFPRRQSPKGTSVGAWMEKVQGETNNDYEMEVLGEN